MNTGQMMLTMGAILLFSLQILNVNTSESDTSTDIDNAKFSIMGVALARSRIDRAFGLKFDEKTIFGNAFPDMSGNPTSGSFTDAASLGVDANETTSGNPDENKFDDFDDYNNFTAVIDTIPSAKFTVVSQVNYVNPKTSFSVSSTPTWDKQITVTVTSGSIQSPIVLKAVNSYWNYN